MFPFVPRKVARASKATSAGASSSQTRHSVHSVNTVSHVETVDAGQQTDIKGKRKAEDLGPPAEDCYTSLCLALSDHAIWSDAHLRSRLVNASDGCKNWFLW